jgi:hypothetical protein
MAFNQLWTSSSVVVSMHIHQLLLWCGAGSCSPLLLLPGKQLLSYACLKQDRPVLVMCFYC